MLPDDFDALLLRAVQDAVLVTLKTGEIVRWNRAAEQLYGWSSEELLGRDVREVTVPAESTAAAEEILTRLRKGEVWSGEFLVHRRDGTKFWAWVSDSPVLDQNGKLVAIIGISRDVTEERRAAEDLKQARSRLEALLAESHGVQDELRRSNRVKDEFLALMSHELRTPLTVITGMADALAAGHSDPGDPSWLEALQELKVYAHRLQAMIENLLLLARVEHEEVSLEPVLLQRLFPAGVAGLRQGQMEISDDLPAVNGNAGWVERIVSNFIENALKYGDRADDVIVRCTAANGTVEVHVLDRGPGVAADEQLKIFEPFYRGATLRTRAPGVGIGLAVCQRLAQLQGGWVAVTAREGGGSDFFLALQALDGDC
ncbi:MAG TPA: PAS domain-containing sensor histidine kinase [Gemmatimonadales bacterium]|nr:PAS domain-containing sensor histidine kinase [Gemmatimonadales bacterium]